MKKGGSTGALGMFTNYMSTATAVVLASMACALPVCANNENTEEYPWGGIRVFDAALSARSQTTLTKSDGSAYAHVTFDITKMEIAWEVEYENLQSSPLGAHIHGPAQPGTNAVSIIDLGVNGLESPIKGSAKVSDAYAQYMLLGWTYVQLKTEEYPQGELRGKLDTVPPADYRAKSQKWGRGEIE